MIINDLPVELDLLKKIVDIEWEKLMTNTVLLPDGRAKLDISKDDVKNMVVQVFHKYLKIRV